MSNEPAGPGAYFAHAKPISKPNPDDIAIPVTSIAPGILSPPPTGELFPPPKPVDDSPKPLKMGQGPPRSDQIRATKSMSELNRSNTTKSSRLGIFKRRHLEDATPAVPALPPPPAIPAAAAPRPPTAARPPTAKVPGPAVAIRVGGGGVVPGTDAPVSAVNAGDRRVLIECGRSRNIFPVTPTTTSVDLIKSAATCMSEPIDVKTAILLEYFSTVGVQRPLRRYEHVRDVMNSWDHDKQNSLLLVNPGSDFPELELSLAGAPQTRPAECSFTLLLSQKPGKWDKRHIVLKAEGQIVSQKDPEKPQDAAHVCNLRDFDIYTPTAEKARKKIKPPKKYCFAIKSQQKTSMFESTQDFVHFFCTADKPTADNFHRAVQSWRSWYLTTVLGEGQKPAPAAAPAAPLVKGRATRAGTVSRPANDSAPPVHTHKRNESTASHYQLGSFQALLDLSQFDQPAPEPVAPPPPQTFGTFTSFTAAGGFQKTSSQFDVNVSPERRGPQPRHPSANHHRQHPPGSMSNKVLLRDDEPLANLTRTTSLTRRRPSAEHAVERRQSNEEFKSSGLLGRQYSQRQRETAERSAQQEGPFTAGPSLLNGGAGSSSDPRTQVNPLAGDGIRRNGSVRNRNSGVYEGGGPRRSSSVRSNSLRAGGASMDLHRPLVDLTPQYREPPQHARKGRGFHPDAVGPGGLIDNATSPDDPINAPASTDWRNRARADSAAAAPPPGVAPPHGGAPGLVDFAMQYREPVHHAKKGRGVPIDHLPVGGTGGLVDIATTPDDPLHPGVVAPPSTTTAATAHLASRARSVRRPPGATAAAAAAALEPFTGEGLLASAQARQGWGDGTKGRGVLDGAHAGSRPMVDLQIGNEFPQQSLLGLVEREQGPPAPVIDRKKRVERVERVGEGF